MEDSGRRAANCGHGKPEKDRGIKGNLPNWKVSPGKGIQTVPGLDILAPPFLFLVSNMF